MEESESSAMVVVSAFVVVEFGARGRGRWVGA
jgi:hypothetical protein